jgi:glutamate synthase (NADPH/NADH) small chain
MGNPKAFLTVKRKEAGYRPVQERILDFGEVEQTLNTEDRQLQASRCLDCGIPYCHWACPLGNRMPQWHDFMLKGNWRQAADLLLATNDFPEFTGRVCPAPCEKSCSLSLIHAPVTIRENEAAALEHAFQQGYIKPQPPATRTGKKVAVVGSGPAGMTVANRLNRLGHTVTVYEKSAEPGGLLRLGIPDFKLNKNIIDRRLRLMEAEGVDFKTSILVGKDLPADQLLQNYDAICIATGAQVPRDLPIPGRQLQGIYFAMDYLTGQNKKLANRLNSTDLYIDAKDKHVLVIGGGDTGADCIGVANRQGAASILQIEIMPKPPLLEEIPHSWPNPFPIFLKTVSSHLEGCQRRWCLNAKRFIGKDGKLTAVEVAPIEWTINETDGKMTMKESPQTESIPVDFAFLALGFLHPQHEGLLQELNLELDERKNIKTNSNQQTNIPKVFAAGDCQSGQSLVVRSIASGIETAKAIDCFLNNN